MVDHYEYLFQITHKVRW